MSKAGKSGSKSSREPCDWNLLDSRDLLRLKKEKKNGRNAFCIEEINDTRIRT